MKNKCHYSFILQVIIMLHETNNICILYITQDVTRHETDGPQITHPITDCSLSVYTTKDS